MRRIVLLLLCVASGSAHAQGRLAFATEAHAFETLDEGEVGTTRFSFTNTGDAPLRLTQVMPSCGCTTPQYPTGAIAPGETGAIEWLLAKGASIDAKDKQVVFRSIHDTR